MKFLRSWVFLAILPVVAHAADNAPVKATPIDQPSITADSEPPHTRWKNQEFQIKNTTGKDFFVYGHSLAHVFIQVFIKDPKSGKWVSQGYGYCGTGAGMHRVKSGASFSATINLPEDIADREFVIEFTQYTDEHDSKGKSIRTQPLHMQKSPTPPKDSASPDKK